MRNDNNLASWWQPTRYCYTCGLWSRLPLIGEHLVVWHLRLLSSEIKKRPQ